MTLYRAIFVVFLVCPLAFVESLRCAHECPFVSLTLNYTVPFNACKHEERQDAQCAVTITIDFKNRGFFGAFYMQKHNTIASLRIETTFQHEIDSIKTIVWYTCKMSDYCDHAFLNELTTNKLAEFDVTTVQQRLLDLLYTPNVITTDIQCVNGSCPSNNYCQAELGNLIMQNYNYTSIDGNFPCATLNSTEPFLRIDQHYFPFQSQAIDMTVRCNTDECNNNSTITEVYTILRNDFVIPLNYSILNINSSYPSTSSTLISFESLIIFSSVLSFLNY
jgi:hypothetical protein